MSETTATEPCGNEDCDRCDPRPWWAISEHRVQHITYRRTIKAATADEALAIFEKGTAWPHSYDERQDAIVQQDAVVIEQVTDEHKLEYHRERCCYHDLKTTPEYKSFTPEYKSFTEVKPDPFDEFSAPGFATPRSARDERQKRILTWARAAFGDDQATSIPQRGLRLLEEAIEAFQACEGNEEIAHQLVTYVFARPPGTVGQELGGVAVTTLALAAAAGLSADEEECREVERVLSKPLAHFTERNANKNAAGFLVVPKAPIPAPAMPGEPGERIELHLRVLLGASDHWRDFTMWARWEQTVGEIVTLALAEIPSIPNEPSLYNTHIEFTDAAGTSLGRPLDPSHMLGKYGPFRGDRLVIVHKEAT